MSISMHGIIMFVLYVWYDVVILACSLNIVSDDTLPLVNCNRAMNFLQIVIGVITILTLAGIL